MIRCLPNFPELFDKIGAFLVEFNKLREARKSLPADKFCAAFDQLVQPRSPSPADEALEAWDDIVQTVYPGTLGRSCPAGSTKMRG